MKRVLIITYYFPPSGGPGVIRPLKFVKYLPTFDWEPFVLTVRQNADFPARDTSLFDEIPDNTPVIRTGIFEPYAIYRKVSASSVRNNTERCRTYPAWLAMHIKHFLFPVFEWQSLNWLCLFHELVNILCVAIPEIKCNILPLINRIGRPVFLLCADECYNFHLKDLWAPMRSIESFIINIKWRGQLQTTPLTLHKLTY